MNWYLKVLKQYFDFSGRARRKEYWMYLLFHFIFTMATIFLDTLLATEMNEVGFFYLIYIVLNIIPGIAVSIRRLHDLGKSGAMLLINLIPFIGPIWFLILTCMEGQSKPNRWGNNPKGIGNDTLINQIGTE
ncbi:DUF805 domain-containing protein [Polaribacter sp.]|uniref:DUF805 domain-containing protein n=1 Tax=Polaribacter sp. TaxID=1920175 RepID=UPI003F6BE7F9